MLATNSPSRSVRVRPVRHFTPIANWLNDPNGLIVIDGEYHLFYQHNPTAPRWGDIHWGHAVSADLVTWEHRPVAIPPDEHGLAFSGSVVIDHDNTAGFGTGAMVAIYTQDLDHLERQSLAYSIDRGLTWTRYEHNPVLSAPAGEPDFRDPKVLRYHDGDDAWWVMIVTLGADVVVYRSDDLKTWDLASRLAVPWPWPGSVAEVPDLVRVPVEGTDESIWTLIVSVIPGTGDRRARVRYLPVAFDGTEIRPFSPDATPQPVDLGPALYAPMVWECSPEAPVMIGWFDETGLDPDEPEWCGRMSLPRRLRYSRRTVTTTGDTVTGSAHLTRGGGSPDLVLRQQPITGSFTALPLGSETELADGARSRGVGIDLAEACFMVSVDGEFGPDDRVRVRLASNATSVGLDISRAGVEIAAIGLIGDEPERRDDDALITLGSDAPPDPESPHQPFGRDATLVVDAGSIEVFCSDGRDVWSAVCDLGLGTTRVDVEVVPGSTERTQRFEPTVTCSTADDAASPASSHPTGQR